MVDRQIKKRISQHWLAKAMLAPLVLFVIAIAALPSLASTNWGQHRLVQALNKKIPGHIEIESIQLSWFGPQILENLVLKDPAGEPVVDVRKLTTDNSLIRLAWSGFYQGQTQISGLNATIIQQTNGLVNLQQALSLHPTAMPKISAPITVKLTDFNADLRFPSAAAPLSLSFKGETKQDNISGVFEADLILSGFDGDSWRLLQASMEPMAQFDQSANIQFKVNVKNFPVALVDHLAALQQPHLNGIAQAILGKTLDLSLDNTLTTNGIWLTMHAESPTVLADFSGQIQSGKLLLGRRANAAINITPELVDYLRKLKKGFFPLMLQNPTKAQLTIDQLILPLAFITDDSSSNAHHDASLLARLTLAPTELESNVLIGPITLHQLEIAINAPESSKIAILQIQGEAVQRGEPIRIKVDATIDKPSNLEALLETIKKRATMRIEAKEVPVALLDRVFNLNNTLADALGSQGSLNAEITSKENKTHLRASLDFDELTIPDLTAEIEGDFTHEAQCAASAHFQWLSKNPRASPIDDSIYLEGKIATRKQMASSSFEVKMTSVNDNDNPLSIVGEIDNFLTPDGALNTQELSINLEAKSRRLPAGLFCQIGCLDDTVRKKIEALLGETVDTDIKVQLRQMSGPLIAQLLGKNGRVTLNAQLTDGVLTLNKNFEIQVNVTPQLGQSILQDVIPILSGVIAADQPIKISIEAKEFAFPLRQLDLSQAQIGLATIELGKMTFSNHGQLGTIFDLLRPSSSEDLSVQFTPIYLNMQSGIVRLGRMDMLILNRYPLALWGKVDTVKDKVDMRIGITGVALSQALNLSRLDKDYMMQLPLKGTMGGASIDKNKAAARISALVAQNQGSAQGMIIGTFLDIAGGSLSEEKPPSPTTNPLPWEKYMLETSTDTEKEKHSSEQGRSDNKTSQIQKAASSLLDKLLK